LITFLSLGTAGIVGVMIGAASGVSGDRLEILSLAIIMTVLGLVPTALTNTRERGHILMSIMGIVFAAYYALPAILRYVPGSGPVVPGSMGDQLVASQDVVRAQWVIFAGMASLFAGYAIPLASDLARRMPTPTFEWSPRSALIVATAMISFGWILTVASAGLPGVGFLQTGFIGGTLASAQLFGLGILYAVWNRRRSRGALRALVVLVPISMIFGLLTGSKQQGLNAAAILMMTHVLLHRKLAWRWIAAAALALVVIYPINRFYQDYVIGSARASAVEVLADPGRVVSGIGGFLADVELDEFLETGFEATGLRLDMLGVVSVLIRDTPSLVPYQYGKTLATLIIAPIPRILWPGKPDNSLGLWITRQYSHGLESNTAPTQIGEYYINFGVIGVIGGLFLLGVLLRIVNESLLTRPTVPGLMAALISLFYLSVKFEGSVTQLYTNVLFALAPLLFTHLCVRAYQRKSAPRWLLTDK